MGTSINGSYFVLLLHKAAEPPYDDDDDDPSCSDYNNRIAITYPTTFTMILRVKIIITGFLLHTPPLSLTRLLGHWTFCGFANWGNGSGSFASVWFGWGSCRWGLLPPS